MFLFVGHHVGDTLDSDVKLYCLQSMPLAGLQFLHHHHVPVSAYSTEISVLNLVRCFVELLNMCPENDRFKKFVAMWPAVSSHLSMI